MKTRNAVAAAGIGLMGLCSTNMASAATDFGKTSATSFGIFFQYFAPPDEFYIDRPDSSEALRFATKRELRVCDEAKSMGMGLDLEQRRKLTSLAPGQCLALNTKHVVIAPASRLPDGMVLVGKMKMVPRAKR